jgi:tRNA G37 N-methylase Trm5
MNLPKDAIEFLDVFIGLFKGCKENIYNKDNLPIIHVYGFAKTNSDSDPIEELKMRIAKSFKIDYNLFKEKCEKDILNIENVRDISNKKVVFCIDMRIPYIIGFKLYDLK